MKRRKIIYSALVFLVTVLVAIALIMRSTMLCIPSGILALFVYFNAYPVLFKELDDERLARAKKRSAEYAANHERRNS